MDRTGLAAAWTNSGPGRGKPSLDYHHQLDFSERLLFLCTGIAGRVRELLKNTNKRFNEDRDQNGSHVIDFSESFSVAFSRY
jgi:hypothetical protein